MINSTLREALAARVRKLQKMTTENGCSESEASFAAQRIAAIMVEHALTQDELRPKIQTGTALIVLKDQLVDDAFARLGLRLCHASGARTIDPATFARGFAAGAHVNIHGGRNATASGPAVHQIRSA